MLDAIKPKSLFFAPMEGITDDLYRNVIQNFCPDWDYLATDFLRVPSSGYYPKAHIQEHFGNQSYNHTNLKNKTIYQILTSEKANTKETVQSIHKLGFTWLDLNIGCPSSTVVKNKGGSFLLTDLTLLKNIIKTIRENFPHRFTCKMRVGFNDDKNLENIIHLLQDEGVEAITVHARTRAQLYKGIADWDLIKRAVKVAKVPLIGNGDIWTQEDINRIFDYTGCHSIMMARGALKSPWMAYAYKNKIMPEQDFINTMIKKYFEQFIQEMQKQSLTEQVMLKRLKSISRDIFSHYQDETIRTKFMRSQTIEEALINI